MNSAFASSNSPLTWIDVARTLADADVQESRPAWLIRARVTWDELLLQTNRAVQEAEVNQWIAEWFPRRVLVAPLRIALEGPPHAVELPIVWEEGASSAVHQSFGIVDGSIDFGCTIPPRPIRSVPVVAALSVKGGTGRTTSAIVTALRWAERAQKPVLLVDGDLEAPGISYLYANHAGMPKISLEDLITLAHLDPSPEAEETIGFVTPRLRDQKIAGNLYVLPLRRDLDELATSAVRPEHLVTPTQPFALTDILANVAKRLGCCGVVIDVRAGLVPLGVNLAMDPDVSPLIVTTLSDQSIRASAGFLRFLTRELKRKGSYLRRPMIVVNRVPAIFKQSGMDVQLMTPLFDAAENSIAVSRPVAISNQVTIFDLLDESDFHQFVQVPELPDLQVASGTWPQFLEQVYTSGIGRIFNPELDRWLPSAAPDESVSPSAPLILSSTLEKARQSLHSFAEQLIAAENAQGKVPKPLVTGAISALASRFQSEVPIAVSEGAKGTGKTLATRYLISQLNWSTAVSELIGAKSAISAHIVPICISIQSSEKFPIEADEARRAASTALGLGQPMSTVQTIHWLKARLAEARSEGDWLQHWLDAIAWSVGFNVNQPNAGEEFLDFLRRENKHVVAVFEGMEELYSSTQQAGIESALSSLLVTLQQRLRSEAKRPLGCLVFARRDTVEAAIKQNLDQYRREYSAYALNWSRDEVLELAAWLATQSHAIPDIWDTRFTSLTTQEKATKLERLWGRKLGRDDRPGNRTKEAYTDTWVIAVLSDLRGRIAPRDLVRLLSSAARVTPDQNEVESYEERLIVPRALRDAVEPTSTAKVHEAEEEIAELRPIFAKFRAQTNEVSAPLDQVSLDQVGVSQEEITVLERHGIVFGDSPPLEVSELYRRGLGLKHVGARLSVVNLYRRAQKNRSEL